MLRPDSIVELSPYGNRFYFFVANPPHPPILSPRMKRPLVPVALFYGGGIILAEFIQPPLAALFLLALALAAVSLSWSRAPHWLLWTLLVCAGWANQASRTGIVSPLDLRRLQGSPAELVSLRGRLDGTPAQRVFPRAEGESARSLAQLDVTHWLRAGADWEPAFGRVLVLTPGRLPNSFFGGQEVEIAGVLSPPPGPVAEGLFDYRSYLRRQGIYFQLKAESTGDWRLLSGPARPPWSDRFLAWAQANLARGLPEEDEALHLLWAMTLGWKTSLTQEIYEPFMRSGTMHIFAISGLHIALIAGILVSLLRVLQLPRGACGWLILPLIWGYTGATGWQPSAIRSTIMMSVIILGWSLHRPSDLVNSLAAAAFIILLWDPQQLFGASFQLSFFVVLSIALLLPPLERVYDGWLAYDPLLPPELVPRWRRRLQIPLRWVAASLATSLAAWLGSLPLTAYYFHLFSPITLPANLLIVPLSGMALACNLGSLLCGSWLPWLTELFNHSAWFWMSSMLRLSDWAELVPCAYAYVAGPCALDFLVYYSLLILSLSGWLWVPQRRRWVLAGLSLVFLLYAALYLASRQVAHLTLVPVNGGAVMYWQGSARADQLLIDSGDTNSVPFTTKPFLRAQGVNRLTGLLLTHGDVHHVGGAETLADLFKPDLICASPIRFRSPVYRRAIEAFERDPERLRRLSLNDRMGSWTVLHPRC